MQKRRKSSTKKKSVSEDADEQTTEVYCVCRSSDIERFMIACDQCEEWYHGDCINVTPKQAEQIKTFFCPQCRCKNPSLEIEYKNTRSQRPKQNRQNSSPNNSFGNSGELPSPTKFVKGKRGSPDALVSSSEITDRKTLEERPSQLSGRDLRKSSSSSVNASSTTHSPVVSESLLPGHYNRDYWSREDQSTLDEDDVVPRAVPSKKVSGSPRLRPCGKCAGCSLQEDCGQCEYCRDRRKFGGPNKMRQKCRLRQCVGASSSLNRDPSDSSPSVGARRRKQQTVQSTPVDISPHMQSYTDFDDEQFEVPLDFSPRPFSEAVPQSFLPQHSTSSVPMGSKMRRGDHRIPTVPSEIDGITSRHFGRFSHDGSQPHHPRNKGSAVPGIYPIGADEHIDFVDDESDDDIVLPEMAHCAGPACIMAAIPGEKYCSESCRLKHISSRGSIRPGVTNARSGMNSLASREVNAIPYSLPYPDHMYCKHHRYQNWHNNPSPSYRSNNQQPPPFDQFTIDQAYITADNFRQSSRGHPMYRCSQGPSPVHRIASQRHPNSHPVLINSSNNRLNSIDSQGHAMICDVNDTTAFIDSMTSIVRRNNNNNNNNHPFGEDLCIDLPCTHPSSTGTHLSSSPNLSGVNSCYTGSNRGDNNNNIRTVVDFHTVVDGDPSGLPADVDDDEDDGGGGGDGGEDDDEAANVDHHIVTDVTGHRVYGYYMIGYSNETTPTNGHSSRVPLTNTTAGAPTTSMLNDRRMPTGSLRANNNMHSRTLNHRMTTQQQQQQHSNGESIMTTATPTNGGIPSAYTVSNRNLNLRHTNMSNILPGTIMNQDDDNCCLSPSESTANINDMHHTIGSSVVTNSNVILPHSVPAYIPGPDEFYTINDSDDLEINWPQETVAGVNG
ncbi:unnamed protein product [Trichobilharzia szidati]|nr:unnamed protein product [Trichobilharzia szidati]